MKKGLIVGVSFLLVLIVLMSFVSSEDLPFEIKKASVILNKGSMHLNIENKIFFNALPLVFKDVPNYDVYLNGIFYSSNSGWKDSYASVKDSSISTQMIGSISEHAETPLFLNVGENELILVTSDLTIDENGNFIPKMIINQYSINDEFYQRLPNGDFVLCSHYEGENQIIDNSNCVFEGGGIRDKFNQGPDVGIIVKFDLTQEQLDSGAFEINDFYSFLPQIGFPTFNAQIGGNFVQGRRIFFSGSGGAPNSDYLLYFNDNFVKEVNSDSFGRIREVFELQDAWINKSGTNIITLKNEVFDLSSFVLYDDHSGKKNEWSAGIWLNDTSGYYGDVISIYGFGGLKPDTEYKLRVRYEGVPGGSIKIITNELGEFQEDNFEINPPVLTDILLFFKNVFSGNPDMLSDSDIERAINNLDRVSIGLEFPNGGIGRVGYCSN